MMKLGRTIIQDELRELDKLILDYRDKEIFVPKDFQPTTLKTKLGEIPIARRRYKVLINGKVEWVYLLDELLEINEPKEVKKKENKIVYAGKYEIASNFTGRSKQYVLDVLRDKKCSELMLIN